MKERGAALAEGELVSLEGQREGSLSALLPQLLAEGEQGPLRFRSKGCGQPGLAVRFPGCLCWQSSPGLTLFL